MKDILFRKDAIEKINMLVAGTIDRRTISRWADSYVLDDTDDTSVHDLCVTDPELYDILVALSMVEAINPDGTYLYEECDFIDWTTHIES